MKIKIFRNFIVTIFLLTSSAVFPVPAFISSLKSCLVIEKKSGSTIISHNSDIIMPAASTIKLVTVLTAVEHLNNDDIITITASAVKVKGTGAGLRKGEKYRFSELVKALLVKSANDAAVAVAVHVSGSEKKYLELMNSWCKSHGFKKTMAADVSGLNELTVSTASELTGIFRLFEKNKNLMRLLHPHETEIRSEKGRVTLLKTTNLLNRFFRESGVAVPGKTGFTRKAGFCFTGVSINSGENFYVTYMGAEDSWRQLYDILSYMEDVERHQK